MKVLIAYLFFITTFCSIFAQTPETLPPDYIKSIEFKGNTEFSGTPIVKLGQKLTLEFDDLIGDEANYYYKIKYYNFDWTPSDLSQNEYMSGFDDMRITHYENSFNTLQIYTHYRLNIPNSDMRALKVSGNYMLEVYNENEDLVFSKRFIYFENLAAVDTEIKRSRDVKYINSKQVVNFTVKAGDQLLFKNPDQSIHTLIIKNNDLKNSIYNLKPQYRMGNELIYRYDQESAFMGGNEFYNFESKDIRGTNVSIRTIELDDIYNVYLYPNATRRNDKYTYSPDINGNFLITTVQGENPKIESEYTWVHFSLQYDPLLKDGEEVHIYGQFNGYAIDDSTQLIYNPDTELYEGKYLFKQGFYDYQYVLVKPDKSIDEGAISGNFDVTENSYIVLVYYREPGARYDRVIGVGTANSKDIKN